LTEGHRLRLTKLAYALALHGLWEVDRREIKALADGPLALELRALLREHFPEGDVHTLMGRHPSGCPCWTCVIGLNRWVQKTAASRHSKRGKRRPLVR